MSLKAIAGLLKNRVCAKNVSGSLGDGGNNIYPITAMLLTLLGFLLGLCKVKPRRPMQGQAASKNRLVVGYIFPLILQADGQQKMDVLGKTCEIQSRHKRDMPHAIDRML